MSQDDFGQFTTIMDDHIMAAQVPSKSTKSLDEIVLARAAIEYEHLQLRRREVEALGSIALKLEYFIGNGVNVWNNY